MTEPGDWFPQERRSAPTDAETLGLLLIQVRAIAAQVEATGERFDKHVTDARGLLDISDDLKAVAEWRRHRLAVASALRWVVGVILGLYALLEGAQHLINSWQGR
jgi:hypothetical protein